MIFSDLASNPELLPALPALPACNPSETRHRPLVVSLPGFGHPTVPPAGLREGVHNRPPQAERDNWGACQPSPTKPKPCHEKQPSPKAMRVFQCERQTSFGTQDYEARRML